MADKEVDKHLVAQLGKTVTVLAANRICYSALTDEGTDYVGIIQFPLDVFSARSLAPTVAYKQKKIIGSSCKIMIKTKK